jgi:hypothetical protein
MDKQHLFYLVYSRTKNKHPEWSDSRVRATSIWVVKKKVQKWARKMMH